MTEAARLGEFLDGRSVLAAVSVEAGLTTAKGAQSRTPWTLKACSIRASCSPTTFDDMAYGMVGNYS
jgi:hypothetical protein